MSPPTSADSATGASAPVREQEPASREARIAAARRALEHNPRLWYHTIELAPGVVTPGFIDLRKAAERILPDDLSGVRALDVGTFDGFWAFELERRGAEVVAIDLEHIELAEFPPLRREKLQRRREKEGFELGIGFRLAAEAIGSRVSRVVCNVYDLTPDAIGGPVDLAMNGATLTHLRDPVRALERIRSALVPGGELLSFEPFSVPLTLRARRRPSAEFRAASTDYTWWLPNLAAIAAWLNTAAFTDVRRLAITKPRSMEPARYVAYSCRRPGG
jgi:tRNA (mo5U34)-methyltransferase